MIFKFFETKPAENFAKKLAVIVLEKIPEDPTLSKDKKAARIQSSIIYQLEKSIADFKKNNTLNFYQKAQVGNHFKWMLLEKGIDKDYIEKMTAWLIKKC